MICLLVFPHIPVWVAQVMHAIGGNFRANWSKVYSLFKLVISIVNPVLYPGAFNYNFTSGNFSHWG